MGVKSLISPFEKMTTAETDVTGRGKQCLTHLQGKVPRNKDTTVCKLYTH